MDGTESLSREELRAEVLRLRSEASQYKRAAREWMRSASRPTPGPYTDAEDAVLDALDRLHHHEERLMIDGMDGDESEPDLLAIATAVLAALGYRKEDHDAEVNAARRRGTMKVVGRTS
jgi:hypothetical protein